MRHEGQATELAIPFEGADIGQIRDRFVVEYERLYGYRDTTPMEITKVRVTGQGQRAARLDFADMKVADAAQTGRGGTRAASFARGAAATAVEIVARASVGETARRGPLIIEEVDATIIVPPDATVRRDAFDCIVMEFQP